MKLTMAEAVTLIIGTGGKDFEVVFIKRTDGSERTMKARLGRKDGHEQGPGLAFDPMEKGLIGVLDIEKNDYRFIPIEGITSVTFDGRKYEVSQ